MDPYHCRSFQIRLQYKVANRAPRKVPSQIRELRIRQLEDDMQRKRSAKDQKDFIRDLLRVAADEWSEAHPTAPGSSLTGGGGVLDRAVGAESLLHRDKAADVQDIPETLITQSMMNKKNRANEDGPEGLGAFELFS